MGFYTLPLVIGIIATIIFICILFSGEGFSQGTAYSDSSCVAMFILALFAMVCWGWFGYGMGVKNGANETAKGHYKTYYVYDKDGKIADTIAEYPH